LKINWQDNNEKISLFSTVSKYGILDVFLILLQQETNRHTEIIFSDLTCIESTRWEIYIYLSFDHHLLRWLHHAAGGELRHGLHFTNKRKTLSNAGDLCRYQSKIIWPSSSFYSHWTTI
jgi:hypothetical protein